MVIGKESVIIEISRSKIVSNVKFLHSFSGKPIMAVVKANAYGHGLTEIVSILDKCDVINSFAVDSLAEALMVKDSSSKPLLIIGHLTKSEIISANQYNIPFVLHTLTQLNDLKGLETESNVHLKLETGTNRLGFQERDLDKLVEQLKVLPNINVLGIYTHFSDLDEGDLNFTNQQLLRYEKMQKILKSANVLWNLSHTASTAASIILPQTKFDLVRCGIGIYGHWPSLVIKNKYIGQKDLQPALILKAQVIETKSIFKGESVGYGRSYIASKQQRIGILPIGYADGYPRSLSSNSQVCFKNKNLPVIGRVAMNMMMIDCTESSVEVGDWVEIISPNITVDYLANQSGSINYEILARLSININRRIVD